MAEITAALVKELREKTGAGMMDCKRALDDTGGDLEAAVDWLRKKGLAAAAQRAGRGAAEGLIGVGARARRQRRARVAEGGAGAGFRPPGRRGADPPDLDDRRESGIAADAAAVGAGGQRRLLCPQQPGPGAPQIGRTS